MVLEITETNPVVSMAVLINGTFETSLNEVSIATMEIKLSVSIKHEYLYIQPNLSRDGHDRIDAIMLSFCGFPYHHLTIKQGKTEYSEPIPPYNSNECEIILGYVRVRNGAVVIFNEDIQIIERFAEHG